MDSPGSGQEESLVHPTLSFKGPAKCYFIRIFQIAAYWQSAGKLKYCNIHPSQHPCQVGCGRFTLQIWIGCNDDTQSKITVIGVPDIPGKAGEIFSVVSEAGANIDMIVQNVSTTEDHLSDISFTLPHSDRAKVVQALKDQQSELGFVQVTYDDEIGKLSVVGAGMKTHPGVSAKLFRALARANVNIEMISTSEIRISVVTRANQLKEATRIVHSAFELDAEQTAVVYSGTGR
jgi:predicted amino acid-binding ACT domain protein